MFTRASVGRHIGCHAVGVQGAVLITIFRGCQSRRGIAVGRAAGASRDIAPVRAIAADLPLNCWCGVACSGRGESGRCAFRSRLVGRLGGDRRGKLHRQRSGTGGRVTVSIGEYSLILIRIIRICRGEAVGAGSRA